jgi:hypothetical protein
MLTPQPIRMALSERTARRLWIGAMLDSDSCPRPLETLTHVVAR